MNKLKKICLILLILIMSIGVTSISKANFDVFQGEVDAFISGMRFNPTSIDGGVIFCIQYGGGFRNAFATITRADYYKYKSNPYIPTDEKYNCTYCYTTTPPWTNVKYFMRYERGNQIDALSHQDEAYNLANFLENDGTLVGNQGAQRATWASSVSLIMKSFAEGAEGKAYMKFYEEIQPSFESKLKDNTGEVDVGVNQDTKKYTVGPLKFEHPNGQYDGKNKFCWVEDVIAYTDDGNFSLLGGNLELLNDGGSAITNIGKYEANELRNKNFYLRFESDEATRIDRVEVKFKYLHHCEAQMYEYIGNKWNVYWTPETKAGGGDSPDSDINCAGHDVPDTNNPKKDADGNVVTDSNGNTVYNTKKEYRAGIRYKFTEVEGSQTQRLMLLVGTATKVWRDASLTMVPGGIDLTMKLAGYVFLDQDTGKVNAGDNKKQDDEGLGGVEVTLCDADGNPVALDYVVKHKHTGDSLSGTGCYTVPVYHEHDGSSSSYGRCYTQSNHTHIGDSTNGGAGTCYATPIYHEHYSLSCLDANGNYDCGMTETTITGYANSCGITVTYTNTCGKQAGDLDYYEPGCGKTEYTIESTHTQGNTKLTASNGYYEFKHLNAMKKYYVRFIYNGMLYTNVARLAGNATDISKSTEEAQGHTGNRQSFNNKFAEIASYPNNYYSPSRAAYNKVFLQEEIAQTFKTIAANFGSHGNTDEEVFAYDCRISAYSTEKYPLIDEFTIDTSWNNIAGKNYDPIYGGEYDQLHVNLGIKARPTFDLALYKDIFTATLNINGKQEVYEYDARKDVTGSGLGVGLKDEDWLSKNGWELTNVNSSLKGKYDNNNATIASEVNLDDIEESSQQTYIQELRKEYKQGQNANLKTKTNADAGQYTHEYRTEEIINGNNTNETYKGWLQDNIEYEKTLYGADYGKNYAWRDINHGITEPDKLQIHVTYKLVLRNQSNVVGAVTEIVDYYDSNYKFESAYVGDKNGNKDENYKVDVRDQNGVELQSQGVINWGNNPKTGSIYGSATHLGNGGAWTTNPNSDPKETRSYKTIYINTTEKKLYNNEKEQYVYVTFGLIDPEKTLIDAGLPSGNKFYTYNMAEINGYKTYGVNGDYVTYLDALKDETKTEDERKQLQKTALASMGLIDRDSNPGNFNPANYVMGVTELEDDESKAPTYVYSIRQSRTLEGNVFEDANISNASNDEYEVKVNTTRFGDGNIGTTGDVNIAGVKVELVEVKNGKLIVRETTTTDANGWYGFGAFLPGDYTIRFTYGADDKTALTKTSEYAQGLNDESYNGQDYQSTIFETKSGESVTPKIYEVDDTLKNIYTANNSAKNSKENNVDVSAQVITKYERDNYYWFDDASIAGKSDAEDNGVRRSQVNAYAKSEYTREITNHKAEVFNSYINQETLRNNEATHNNFNEFTQAQPMEEEVADAKNRALVDELERRTYMYAYTPEINVEVEYTTKTIEGNQPSDKYTYKITGVDFGVVERPRTQLTIDQDVKHIKVIASDGTTLLEIDNKLNGTIQVIVDNGNNYQWLKAGKVKDFDEDELINIILDDELLSGAKLEVTYNIEVTNNSEQDKDATGATVKTAAKTIINYVANNLNFDLADNKDINGNNLWEAVKKQDIQTDEHSTYINNATVRNVNLVDLSTQTTVLKATTSNPLTKELAPGESTTSTLTLKKTLSAESSDDDLKYANLTEIVEIDNTVGRYDHGAIPGNQSLEEQPREHDTSGASRYDETGYYEPDGEIIITPPTGSKYIYYVLPITLTAILAIGIILIKKFVLPKK